jgi:Fe-S oxidoreductase
VVYHAGCRYSYDQELWPIAQAGVKLLQKAGVDIVLWRGWSLLRGESL